jgi:hypothetical protein
VSNTAPVSGGRRLADFEGLSDGSRALGPGRTVQNSENGHTRFVRKSATRNCIGDGAQQGTIAILLFLACTDTQPHDAVSTDSHVALASSATADPRRANNRSLLHHTTTKWARWPLLPFQVLTFHQ